MATASTSYNEPFHVARKFASLDHLSGGRAGWNLVTSGQDEEAYNFNRDVHYRHAERYPNGMLAEERMLKRMVALCELGRVAEARQEARQFVKARPNSPLSVHASRICPDAPLSTPHAPNTPR